MQQAHAPNQYQWPIAWDCCRNNIIIAMELFAARTSNGIIAARMGLTVKNMCLFLGGRGFKREGDRVCTPLYSSQIAEQKDTSSTLLCST